MSQETSAARISGGLHSSVPPASISPQLLHPPQHGGLLGNTVNPLLITAVPSLATGLSGLHFFFFNGHTEVSGLAVQSELHLRTKPPSQQCRILNPLSEARDCTHILMNTMSGS